MKKPAVLLFAYYYPPDNAIGAARPARFTKYLTRLGYRCIVVTAACPDSSAADVIHVPDPFNSASRNIGWHMERALRWSLFPGAAGTQWCHSACAAARNLLRDASPNRVTILSTFPPMGAHWAAWMLARNSGLPWIADFRDPMASPFRKILSPWHFHFRQWMEDRIIRAADLTIANTDAAAEVWRQRHPRLRGRVHVIWNGFDPEQRISALPLPKRDYRLLSHAGQLYYGRTAAPLIESISRLVDSGRLPPSRIRVRLLGPAQHGTLPPPDVLARAQRKGWLELQLESIPQADARRLTQTSDGLLLVQPQSSVQVPGKLYEYLQIGRPILAFVPPGSPIERILERSGVPYRCVYPGAPPEVFDNTILSFLDLSSDVAASPWFEENFNAERQTEILHNLIQRVNP
ncbi:MAG: glycosyltransferase [Bryobacterales bacterium]|nr:glycosyltransferase [Bryobacterales bacterium]